MDLPQFEELYAVSDIHMGGVPGFQIFGRVERLAQFILRISSEHPGQRTVLVLNGDIIDSLAQDIRGYIATIEAEDMMNNIYTESAWTS